jgi:hypothetical protein
VVAIAAVEHLCVDVGTEVTGDSAEEFFYQGEWEILCVWSSLWEFELEVWAVREVNDYARKRLVHWEVCVAVAGDAFLVAESFFEAFANDDAGVFDSVVEVDFDVTGDFDIEVDESVT